MSQFIQNIKEKDHVKAAKGFNRMMAEKVAKKLGDIKAQIQQPEMSDTPNETN
jgi:hypothetical protein